MMKRRVWRRIGMGQSQLTGNRSEATVVSELSGCCREESLQLEDKDDAHRNPINSPINQTVHADVHSGPLAKSAVAKMCLSLVNKIHHSPG